MNRSQVSPWDLSVGLTFGAMATLTGAGVGSARDSAGLARTIGGLLGLFSAISSNEEVGLW